MPRCAVVVLLVVIGCSNTGSAPAVDSSAGPNDAGVPADAGNGGAAASWSGVISLTQMSASAECAAAMPQSAGAPVVIAIDARPGSTCDAVTADGSGRVLAQCWTVVGQSKWTTFNGSGAHLAQFDGWRPIVRSPAPDGFVGVAYSSAALPPFWEVVHRSAYGALVHGDVVGNEEHPSVVNRRFASGVVVAGLTASSPHSFAVAVYDGEGQRVSQVNPSLSGSPGIVAVTEDRSAAVAYASGEPSGPLSIVFIDPATGSATRPLFFSVPPPRGVYVRNIPYGTWVQLFGLAGGGVVIVVNGVFTYVAKPASNTIEPAPAWLAAHAGEAFRIVRHGDAQALIRVDADSTTVSVVSRDGEVCGTISISDFIFGDIGLDGTLVGSTAEGSGVVKVWWPGLLH